MRHRKKLKKLGRTRAHRKSLLRNQVISLFQKGKIKTTIPKAKETRKLAEKIITLAKKNTQSARRRVFKLLGHKQVCSKLFEEIVPKFTNINSGYTRIIKLGPRKGDGAEEGVLEFIFH